MRSASQPGKQSKQATYEMSCEGQVGKSPNTWWQLVLKMLMFDLLSDQILTNGGFWVQGAEGG